MDWEKWPLYVQRRYALGKAVLKNPAVVCSDPLSETESAKADDVVGWLYGVLTTLDAKASALMRLGGVLIAASAFLLGLFRRQGGSILLTSDWNAAFIVLLAFLSAISIFCCLLVVNISWPFLGRATRKADRSFEFAAEIKFLDRACTFRQGIYRLAWAISLIASMGFLVEFLLQTAFVFYTVTTGQAPWS